MSATGVKGHRAHVLVTAIGGKGRLIERRLAVTQVTALAAQEAGVMWVYWAEGTLVHYPVLFAKMAEKMTNVERPPPYLRVDFRVMRNHDRSSAMFTTGLRAPGLMEVEIPRMEMGPGELREWAVSIAGYLLTSGSQVKDGDTIGVSESQRIRVRHVKSVFGISEDVMRLEETG